MTDWHVGMKVCCVKSAPYLQVGTVYTVAEVEIRTDGPYQGSLFLCLQEIGETEVAKRFFYWRGYFRFVVDRKTDISIFTAMLDPTRVRETV